MRRPALALCASAVLVGACGDDSESQSVKPNVGGLPQGVVNLLGEDADDVGRYECIQRGERTMRCKVRAAGETRSFFHREHGWIEVTNRRTIQFRGWGR